MVSECEIPTAQFLTEKPDKALARPGVYAILCDANGKYYVGSSINIRDRIRQHALSLEKETHSNPKMSGAFNKYGGSRMLYKALEFCPADQNIFLEREKVWLDALDAVDSGMNFSRDPFCGGKKEREDTDFCLIPPPGTAVRGKGLKSFCRINGLYYPSIASLVRGERKSSSGWTAIKIADFSPRPRRNQKERFLVSPSGELISFKNMADFCRRNQLCVSAILQVLKGKRPHHKNWRKQ